MGKRHRARESALQCLYQWEVTGAGPDQILAGYWETREPVEVEVRNFTESLVRGTVTHVARIDAIICEQTRHWRMDRLGLVEKSILRLGGFELLYAPETPAAVVIDEAVELSKRFSGPEAAPFVNGILDGIHERSRRGELDLASTCPPGADGAD